MGQIIYQGNFGGDWRPWLDGAIFLDNITRDRDNHVSWQFNTALWVAENGGYWDYPWKISWDFDGYSWLDVLVKDWTSGNIAWQWKYMTDVSPHFTGSKSISGQATSLLLTVWFHDDYGHWGGERYISVPIPVATAPGTMYLNSSTSINPNNGSVTATVSGNCGSTGNYAHITKWRLEYGEGSNYTQNVLDVSPGWDVTSYSWNLTGLKEKTKYTYHITAWNSAGYASWKEGTFTTPEYISGNVVTTEKTSDAEIWVVTPERQARVVDVVKVEA